MESIPRILPPEQKLLLLNLFWMLIMHMRAGFSRGAGLPSSTLRGSMLYIYFLINKKTMKSVLLKNVESKLWEVRIFV